MRINELLCEITYGSPRLETALGVIIELLSGEALISCPLCRGAGVVEEYTDVYGGTRETACPLCGGDKVVSAREIISSYLKEEEIKELDEIEF